MSQTTSIVSLPDDMIFDILVRIPAQDIHDAARLVCTKWYRMIRTHDFKHAHSKQSSSGLLIQEFRNSKTTFFAIRGKGQIEMHKLSYESKQLSWSMASCNGLILEYQKNNRDFYITNPATVQRFALPPILAKTTAYCTAIAYAAASMAYKVVCTYQNLECAILSVGVDKDWRRRVSTQHLSPTAMELFTLRPLTTEGFVHWANTYLPQFVLTLNVETEIITQIPVPCDNGRKLSYFYLTMGSNLSLLETDSCLSWKVWEMRPENGEWTHMLDFDLEPHQQVLSFKLKQKKHFSNWRFEPVGWVNLREMLVFRVYLGVCGTTKQSYITYNVCTREIDSFELDCDFSDVLEHKNSLLWLDG